MNGPDIHVSNYSDVPTMIRKEWFSRTVWGKVKMVCWMVPYTVMLALMSPLAVFKFIVSNTPRTYIDWFSRTVWGKVKMVCWMVPYTVTLALMSPLAVFKFIVSNTPRTYKEAAENAQNRNDSTTNTEEN